MMEAKLKDAISKLPTISKAHIDEPSIEDVAEISYNAGKAEIRRQLTEILMASYDAVDFKRLVCKELAIGG